LDTNNLSEITPPQQSVAVDSQNPQPGKRKRRRRRKGGSVSAQAVPNGEFQSTMDAEPLNDSSDAAPIRAPDSGQEQGGGGKRRKRNRRKKNKQAAQQAGQPQAQAQPQQQARPAEQPVFRRQNNGNGNGYGAQSKGGNGGGRRNRQQRRGGSQAFVGPMDHMYRGSDSLADSTIGVNGNYRQPSRNHNSNLNVNGNIATYEETQTVPIAEDAPVRVFCFIDDLFFHAKIRETAKLVGIKIEFVKNDKEQIEHVLEVAADHPVLVVVDLNNLSAKPIPLVKKLRPKLSKGSSLIGFVSHVQGELKMEAQEAGCDVVMPRSAFSSNLANILRRYMDENGDEPNFNTEGALGY